MGVKEVFLVLSVLWVAASAQDESQQCPTSCTCTDSYGEMTVSCGGRGFTQVPSNIPENTEWLVLKYNNIAKIGSHDFKGLKQLKGIDLSNSHIRRVSPGAFRHLVHLDNVDLSGNALRTLAKETFAAPLRAAKQDGRRFFVYLADNPWRCDCHLKWLAEQYANGSVVYSKRLVNCDAPDSLNGTFLSDVSLDDFKCDTEVTFVDPEEDNNTAPENDQQDEKRTPKRLSMGPLIATFVVVAAVVLAVVVVFSIRKGCPLGKQSTEMPVETRPMIAHDNTEVYM